MVGWVGVVLVVGPDEGVGLRVRSVEVGASRGDEAFYGADRVGRSLGVGASALAAAAHAPH